jgi:hypothetical protein
MKNIYYLLRQEFYDQRKRAMVFGAVIFLINLVSRIIEEIAVKFGSMGNHNYQEGIGGYLFAAGFIFTSMCFATSMHSRRGQHAWLMLPVYAHEKLAAKIITYSLAYPLILILFTFVSSLIAEGAMWIIFRNTVPLFNLFDPMIWQMVGHYIVASSLFLMGASYFKSAHLIKTVLSVLLFSVSLSIILGLVTRVAYNAYFDNMLAGNFNIDENLIMAAIDVDRWGRIGEIIGKSIYWGVLTPLFWTVTYFRIREKEAKDAV